MWLLGNPANYFNGRRQIVYLFCDFTCHSHCSVVHSYPGSLDNQPLRRESQEFYNIAEEKLVQHHSCSYLINAGKWFKRVANDPFGEADCSTNKWNIY